MQLPSWRRQPSDGPTVLPRQLAERSINVSPVDDAPVTRPLSVVAPARDDAWLIGSTFRAYQERHGLVEAQLAILLQMPVERLRWLQMRTRPKPGSPTYDADVARLARSFHCDVDALIGVLTAE